MTKHRRITGLVVIALFAVATAATMRSHSPSTANSAGEISFNQRMADLDKLPADILAIGSGFYLMNR
jgi:hypothetical protein